MPATLKKKQRAAAGASGIYMSLALREESKGRPQLGAACSGCVLNRPRQVPVPQAAGPFPLGQACLRTTLADARSVSCSYREVGSKKSNLASMSPRYMSFPGGSEPWNRLSQVELKPLKRLRREA